MTSAVIEVGANNGRDTERLFQQYYCDLFTFEPVPQLYEVLKQRYFNHPYVRVFPDAVSIKEGYADFHITKTDPNIKAKWGASSLYNFREGLKDDWARKDFEMVETVKVRTRRLDNFIEELGITKIVYLHVDAQGEDLNVLRSLGKYVNIVERGQIETTHSINLYDNNDNNYLDAVEWLTLNGFVLEDVKMNDPLQAEINIRFMRKKCLRKNTELEFLKSWNPRDGHLFNLDQKSGNGASSETGSVSVNSGMRIGNTI